MSPSIFLISNESQLTELREGPYPTEDLLQRLLADHPVILAGEDMNSVPRRWLLVTREAAIPDSEGGSGRWSVDHVFLDQEAVPTLVEVKRSTDNRLRREVVGQMLDYAANALAYWPPERLRLLHEARCQAQGIDADDELRAVLGEEMNAQEFWDRAKTNLGAGRLRLVFVADVIPPELRRIVEFLNGQMDPAEVLAIEVRQYVGEGLRTLVPVVVGQTAEAQRHKSGVATVGEQWNELRFMAALGERDAGALVDVAQSILRWAERQGTRITWGRGRKDGSFVPVLDHAGVSHTLFAVYSYGRVEIYFQHYLARAPFQDEGLRRELLNKLNAIPGVQITIDSLEGRPSIPLSILRESSSLQRFLSAFDWFCDRIRTNDGHGL
jgi:hypothetical protein